MSLIAYFGVKIPYITLYFFYKVIIHNNIMYVKIFQKPYFLSDRKKVAFLQSVPKGKKA